MWLQLAAAVAAALAQNYNQAQVAKKQNRAAVASIMRQQEEQRRANQAVNENIDQLEKSTPDDEYATRSSQIRNQLRQKQAMALAGIQNYGGGDAVTSMADAAKLASTGYGDQIGNWLSGIDAPILQRQGEAFERGDMGSRLDVLRRNSAQEANLLRMRMAGIRENPWLNMLSAGLSAYAGSGVGGGGSSGQAMAHLGGQTPQDFYAYMPYANMPASIFTPIDTSRRASGIGMSFGG